MEKSETIFQRVGPTRFMYYLGKYLPPPLGLLVVLSVTKILIARRSSIYVTALANQRHVLGPAASDKVVQRVARRQIYHSVLGYYHTFHNLGWGKSTPDRVRPRVKLAPGVLERVTEAVETGRGLLILGTHTSNYDLCGIALSHMLPHPPMALSLAEPASGHLFFNHLRNRLGRGSVTPISPGALREAMRRLQQGGIVLTAVDRPLEKGNQPVEFFGDIACLPTGYIRIPLMTDCLVMTMAFRWDGHSYWIHANPPMEMARTGQRRQDVEVNLRRVLSQVEAFIRADPTQWMVSIPVWPEKQEGTSLTCAAVPYRNESRT